MSRVDFAAKPVGVVLQMMCFTNERKDISRYNYYNFRGDDIR